MQTWDKLAWNYASFSLVLFDLSALVGQLGGACPLLAPFTINPLQPFSPEGTLGGVVSGVPLQNPNNGNIKLLGKCILQAASGWIMCGGFNSQLSSSDLIDLNVSSPFDPF